MHSSVCWVYGCDACVPTFDFTSTGGSLMKAWNTSFPSCAWKPCSFHCEIYCIYTNTFFWWDEASNYFHSTLFLLPSSPPLPPPPSPYSLKLPMKFNGRVSLNDVHLNKRIFTQRMFAGSLADVIMWNVLARCNRYLVSCLINITKLKIKHLVSMNRHSYVWQQPTQFPWSAAHSHTYSLFGLADCA